MTALYPQIIYGPVRSRRLGISLGVNLLPQQSKVCTFDCIYCECGWNSERRGAKLLPSRDQVREALSSTLEKMATEGALPDVITFAGNGEPTIHPEFEAIINDTIELRNLYAPQAKVSVLSNATQLHRQDVVDALHRIDNNILKLDSAFDSTIQAINKPCGNYSVATIIDQLKSFEGELIVQTMFLRGECDGATIDNTTDHEIEAWLKVIGEIAPKQVMIYSIARDTPCQTLSAVSREELSTIAKRVEELGVMCSLA